MLTTQHMDQGWTALSYLHFLLYKPAVCCSGLRWLVSYWGCWLMMRPLSCCCWKRCLPLISHLTKTQKKEQNWIVYLLFLYAYIYCWWMNADNGLCTTYKYLTLYDNNLHYDRRKGGSAWGEPTAICRLPRAPPTYRGNSQQPHGQKTLGCSTAKAC